MTVITHEFNRITCEGSPDRLWDTAKPSGDPLDDPWTLSRAGGESRTAWLVAHGQGPELDRRGWWLFSAARP